MTRNQKRNTEKCNEYTREARRIKELLKLAEQEWRDAGGQEQEDIVAAMIEQENGW